MALDLSNSSTLDQREQNEEQGKEEVKETDNHLSIPLLLCRVFKQDTSWVHLLLTLTSQSTSHVSVVNGNF